MRLVKIIPDTRSGNRINRENYGQTEIILILESGLVTSVHNIFP